jgi:hypothetical protein
VPGADDNHHGADDYDSAAADHDHHAPAGRN